MKPYKIPNNITVSDLVVALYGTMDLAVKFINDNLFITSINFDLSSYTGAIVFYDPNLTQSTPANLKYVAAPPNTEAIYQVKQGQTIYDICMQVYLTLDRLNKLIDDNNLADIFTQPDKLMNLYLTYDSTLTANSSIFNSHKNSSLTYATSNANIFVTLEGASFNDDFSNDFDNGNP